MANPSTASSTTASAAVDEALRITADNARRTTESAKAAVQAARGYLDQTVELNRQLLGVFSANFEAGLKASFDVQNAALANSLSLLDASATINRDALQRFAEVTRQGQQVTLKAYQAGAKAWESFAAEK
jgi:hypothetical protein